MKTERTTVSFPSELLQAAKDRARTLGYRSLSAYLLGLALYDLWCRQPHKLTRQIVDADDEELKDVIYREILESQNHPARESSWFAHRLQELAEEIATQKISTSGKGVDSPPPASSPNAGGGESV